MIFNESQLSAQQLENWTCAIKIKKRSRLHTDQISFCWNIFTSWKILAGYENLTTVEQYALNGGVKSQMLSIHREQVVFSTRYFLL